MPQSNTAGSSKSSVWMRSSASEQPASRSKEYCAVCRLQSDMVTVHYCEVRLAMPVGVDMMSHGHGWCSGALGWDQESKVVGKTMVILKRVTLSGLAKSGEQPLNQSKCVMIYQVQQVWRQARAVRSQQLIEPRSRRLVTRESPWTWLPPGKTHCSSQFAVLERHHSKSIKQCSKRWHVGPPAVRVHGSQRSFLFVVTITEIITEISWSLSKQCDPKQSNIVIKCYQQNEHIKPNSNLMKNVFNFHKFQCRLHIFKRIPPRSIKKARPCTAGGWRSGQGSHLGMRQEGGAKARWDRGLVAFAGWCGFLAEGPGGLRRIQETYIETWWNNVKLGPRSLGPYASNKFGLSEETTPY